MKLRYYLRGLGLGIIVTALVLTIVGGDKESLSDEEIKRRAAGLGMVENSSLTLADLQNTTASTEETDTEAEISNVEATASVGEEVTESSEAGQNSSEREMGDTQASSGAVEEDTQENDAQESKEASTEVNNPVSSSAENDVSQETPSREPQSDIVSVTVQAGESSYTVSKQLEELGLIEDALSFDKYLCDIGYSRVIHTGTHKIVIGATEEEIAKIITGKR